ncbi:hypothetical protein [Hyphomonas sp.]|jgi:hypothetical protein|uniref:hypothetical protein n=1 Tax=Hyphomonas sp. TaxID=87 RepID=UPI0039E37B42
MSLLSPPWDLPAHLRPAWPWIWLQHLVLLAWIRLTYARGYLYCWAITDTGRVELLWIDRDLRNPAIVQPVEAPASKQLAAALSGEAFDPVFAPALSPATFAHIMPAARAPIVRPAALPLPGSRHTGKARKETWFT